MSRRSTYAPWLALLLTAGWALLLSSCRKDGMERYAELLDRTLADKALFDAEKERRIDGLRLLLDVEGLTPEQEYGIDERLYDEFKKYRIDSAIRYMERNVALARTLGDRARFVRSRLRLACLYSSSGQSIEALRILESIRGDTLPRDLRYDYYHAYNQFYQHYAALSRRPEPQVKMLAYLDSMDRVCDSASLHYRLSRPFRSPIFEERPDSLEGCLLRLYDELEADRDPRLAEVAYWVAYFYRQQGDRRRALDYYMLSAIADVCHSIKENSSFQVLATECYAEGDLARAFRYAQAAIEDAQSCAVQFRAVQTLGLYSIISASAQAREAENRFRLQRMLALVCLLLAVAAALFGYAYVQVYRLRRIRHALLDTNHRLERFNDELAEKNDELAEANIAKVQYIARFSDLCSMYIDKMDAYRKSLKKLVQDQKFDQLYRQLKSTSMLENEQKEFYKTFDSIFLNLYPTFVEEFNALLAEEERIERRPGDLLNRELRIYALLRLGIADSQRIASFLRCSLSTVYNYRTRMRNRAAVPREEFEERVMQIGKINRKVR